MKGPWARSAVVRARVLLLALLLLPLGSAAPAEVEARPTQLPSFRFDGAAAALDGAMVYGGGQAYGVFHDEILRYDPSSEQIVVLPAHLPGPRAGPAAIANDTHVFFLGGMDVGDDGAVYLDEIVRFDGTTTETLDVRLPRPGAYWTAVWADDRAYLFGGETCEGATCPDTGCTDEGCPVIEFVPATGQVRQLDDVFPHIRGAAGVWTGDEVFLYGGRATQAAYYLRTIIRFTPEAGLEVQDLLLLEERHNAVATWHDGQAYVFGGNDVSGRPGFKDTIYVHDPQEDALYVHHLSLPEESSGHRAARIGADTFIMGGGQEWIDIYRFRPETEDASTSADAGSDEGGETAGTTTSTTTTTTTTDPGGPDAAPDAAADCDPRPTTVDSRHDPLGRTFVHWTIDPSCPASKYVVWGPDGTQVGIQNSRSDRAEHDMRVPSPGPGEHIYLVQPMEEAPYDFDAGLAVAAPPLVIEAESAVANETAPVDATNVATAPSDGFPSALLGGLVVFIATALLLVFLVRRR